MRIEMTKTYQSANERGELLLDHVIITVKDLDRSIAFYQSLKAGERWPYEPPTGHTVLWTAIASGTVSVPDELRQGDLAAFEPSSEAVEFEARTDAEFVLGSAVPHKYDLVLGSHSVHDARRVARCPGPLISSIAPSRREPITRVRNHQSSCRHCI
jgi:catechol 2,3-dioxygenase-like lactoylglutathione lyase family enzyme